MSIIPRQLSFAGGSSNNPENPGNIPRFLSDLRPIAELPEHYRSIFQDYATFNIVQSKTLDDVLYSDVSVVVSAPTGSGKTGVFELAIVRMLMILENTPLLDVFKMVYLSPMKALCEERLIDWNKKFQNFNINCISVTGDSDVIEFQHLLNHNLIITTPEKWDSLTRRWKDNKNLVQVVKLFMIDEVHLLHEETRGSTLEAVVCRMKTIQDSLTSSECDEDIAKYKVRFVAASATVANIEDIADWIGKPVKYFKFSDEMRPVKLKKIVLGYRNDPKSTWFKFDLMLNYKLQSLLIQYANGKPTLIFCSTRKIVEMTAVHIFQHLTICLNPEQKERLSDVAKNISDVKVKEMLVNGVGYHHAGMLSQNRHAIENLFRSGDLPVLVTTRTLAMGVNLPAHLVIIKSTKVYDNGEYTDYTETAISQMIGRAGRPQFDTSATALILTSLHDKEKYEKMVGGTEPVESNLHRHLTEHLNAEVVLHTITDLDVALKWLSSTFLYIRARKNPRHYGLSVGMTSEEIDKRLLDMAKIYINKLVKAGMLSISGEKQLLTPTKTGQLMAKYCLAFETVKLFTQVRGDEILQQIVGLISKCQEFSNMFLRTRDKKCLNLLNKNKTGETIRFPLTGKIKTLDMKINCVLQAILGCLDIGDHSILTETLRIMRYSERIVTCLIEYLVTRKNCYSALLNSVIMAKCIRTKLWEDSPHICKQFGGIGIVMSSQLVKAGKTSFEAIRNITGREIEFILNKKPPMGSNILDQVLHLPVYDLTLQKVDDKSFQLIVTLKNASDITKKCTANTKSCMYLIIGDSFNNLLHYEKLPHSRMIQTPEIVRFVDVSGEIERVMAHFISEDWVGIDCNAVYESPGYREVGKMKKAKTRNKSQTAASTLTSATYMEKFLQLYKNQCAKSVDRQPEEEEKGEEITETEQQSEIDENQNVPDTWDHVDAIENPVSSGKSDNDDEQFWDDKEIDTFLQNLDNGMENVDGDDEGKRQLLLDKAYNEVWGKVSKEGESEVGTLTQIKKQLDDIVDFDDMFGPKTSKINEEPASKEEDYWRELEMQYNNLKNDWNEIPNSKQKQIDTEKTNLIGNVNQEYFQDIGSGSVFPFEPSQNPNHQDLQYRLGISEDNVLRQQMCGKKDDTNSTRRRYSSTATNNRPIMEVDASNSDKLDALGTRNDLNRFGDLNFFEEQIWGSNEITQQIQGRSTLYNTTASDLYHNNIEQNDQESLYMNNNFYEDWERSLIQDISPKRLANERRNNTQFESDLSKTERARAVQERTENEYFDGEIIFEEKSKSRVVNGKNASSSSRSNLSNSEKSKQREKRINQDGSKETDGAIYSKSPSKEEIIDLSYDQMNAVAEQTWRKPLRDERNLSKNSSRSKFMSGSIQGQTNQIDEINDHRANQSVAKKYSFEEQIWGSIPQEESSQVKRWSDKENFESNKQDVSRNEIDPIRKVNYRSELSRNGSTQNQRDESSSRSASRCVVKKNMLQEEIWGSIPQEESSQIKRWSDKKNFESNKQDVSRNEIDPIHKVSDRSELSRNGSTQNQRDESSSRSASRCVVKKNMLQEEIWGSIPQEESSQIKRWSDKENFESNKQDVSRNEIDPIRKVSDRSQLSRNESTQNQSDESNSQSASRCVVKKNMLQEEIWGSIPQVAESSQVKRCSGKENFGSNKSDASRNGIDLSKESDRSNVFRNGSIQDQRNARNNRSASRHAVKRNIFEEQIWGPIRQGESSFPWSDEENLESNKADLQQSLNKSKPLMEVYDQGANHNIEDTFSRRNKELHFKEQIEQHKSNQAEIEESQESFYSIQIRNEDGKKPCHKRKQTKPKRTSNRPLCFTDIRAVVKEISPIRTATPSSISLLCNKFKYTPRKKLPSSPDDKTNRLIRANQSHKLDFRSPPNGDSLSQNNEERREENIINRKITWRSPLVFSPKMLHTPKLDKKTPPQSVLSSVDDYYSLALSNYKDSPIPSVKDSISHSLPLTTVKTQTTVVKPQKCKTKPNPRPLPLPLSDIDYKDSSKDDSKDNTYDLDGSLNRTSQSEQLRRSQVETEITPSYNTPSLSDFYSQILRKYNTPKPQPPKRTLSPINQPLSKTPKISQSKLLPLSDLESIQNNDGSTYLERKTLHKQDSYYSQMMQNYQQNLEKHAAKKTKTMSVSDNDVTTSDNSYNERHSPVETFESFRSGLEALRTDHANKELLNCSQFSSLNVSRIDQSNGMAKDSGVNSEISGHSLTAQLSPKSRPQTSTSAQSNYEVNLNDEHFDMNQYGCQSPRLSGYEIDERRQRMRQYPIPPSPLREPSSVPRGVTDDSGINSGMLRGPLMPPVAAFLSRELQLNTPIRRDYEMNQIYQPTGDFDYDRDRYRCDNSRRFGYEISKDDRSLMHYPRHPQLEQFASQYEPRRYEPYPHRELYRPSYDVPYRDYDYRSQRYNVLPLPPPPLYYSQPRPVSYRPRMIEPEMMPREPINQNYMIRKYFNSMDEGPGEEEATDELFCFND